MQNVKSFNMARGKSDSPRELKNPFRRHSVLSVDQLRQYCIIKRIGRGSFGAVYKAKKKGIAVALKLVNLREASRDEFFLECQMTKIFSELKAGPNYVKSWSIPSKKVGVIVTELWDTNLGKFMDNSGRKSVPKLVLDKIQTQLDQIHAHGISHFDLHADNILLRLAEDGKVCDATLTDFGHAKHTEALEPKELEDIIDNFELPRTTSAADVDQLQFNQIKREWK